MSKELIDKISRATGRYPVSCDCPVAGDNA